MIARVAVVMTVHNRREQTVECIRALNDQDAPARLSFFVTDDGSTDGTREALRALPIDIRVIDGDGSLYWAGGMALAEQHAMIGAPDYLLWLNDDTVMDPGALSALLELSEAHPGAIIVGATRDPETGAMTYGGRARTSSWHPQRLQLLPISPHPQRADTFNGNLVLIPRSAREHVGPIDAGFPHAYADDDYGLRATELGVEILQAPETVATCARGVPTARRAGLSGWRAMQNPKGLPWRAQARFLRRHGGPAWPLVFVGQQAAWLIGRRAY